MRARVQARIDRLAFGNPGQHRVLTGGLIEMKIDYGPGYRIYYTRIGTALVLLLCGGSKATQAADITRAKRMALSLQRSQREERTMAIKISPWDSADYLTSEAHIVAYLNACLEEGGDDPAYLAHALGVVARARAHNMSALARDVGLSREGLYKALSDAGNPSFATVSRSHALLAYASSSRLRRREGRSHQGKGRRVAS